MPSIHIEKEMKAIFEALHDADLYADGKLIADVNMELSPEQMLSEYNFLSKDEDFDLEAFFESYTEPNISKPDYKPDTTHNVEEHINKLWSYLTRKPKKSPHYSTLISLPKKYIVPGGRFNEVYYWDSYFTMLGLQVSGHIDLIESMLNNFAWLIDQYGFIPNGNRTYFLSRSQPPFFSLMVSLLAESKGDNIYTKYLPQLQKEYQFWMSTESTCSRVSQIGDHTLNLYGDSSSTPRVEMYSDDIRLTNNSKRDENDLMINVRAACESGWDFSSRWFGEEGKLDSIRTRSIVPVDLNCLLYQLEKTISKASLISGDEKVSKHFEGLAEKRKKAILTLCWNEKSGFFHDYDLETMSTSKAITLAGSFPLFMNIATEEQANSCGKIIESTFLQKGGLITTTITSGQQWDAPNGWAPLQWIVIEGLRSYKLNTLADEISKRWTELNIKVFENTGKLMEKYNVVDTDLESGGGEYPVQDGFGWTNGVLLKLLQTNPV